MPTFQPIDWYEHDDNYRYVIDAYGRLQDNRVACVRITGFKPYFYVKGPQPSNSTRVSKYDMMAGFNSLQKTDVWKVECDALWKFRKAVKDAKVTRGSVLYESNLHPFLRMFHEQHIGPASPFQFEGNEISIPVDDATGEPLYNVDVMYRANVTTLKPVDATIPLLVASYDLEVYSESGLFPQARKGDPIIQIGISYRWSNRMMESVSRIVLVLGDVAESTDPTVDFVSYPDESALLLGFAEEIRLQNPDIICGYNTFGFDDAYVEDRCTELGILDQVRLSRGPMDFWDDTKEKHWDHFAETKKFELASGKYDLRIMNLRGRLGLDLLLNMRREHSLDSFKLDNVASVFLRNKVTGYEKGVVKCGSTRGLSANNFVRFDLVGNTSDPYRGGEKFLIDQITKDSFTLRDAPALFDELTDAQRKTIEWTFTKDDIEIHELFDAHKNGGPEGRARIARYCIQDCDLVLTLMAKLDTIVNARGMADVCKVPLQYVLARGQGIKIFSAVVYYASQRDQIIQLQDGGDFGDSEGYEGAIVLPPKIGMYLDQPVSVLDFNSLYPTNMIAYNLSPDTFVSMRVFDSEGQMIKNQCEGFNREAMDKLEEAGYVLEDIEYDTKDSEGNIEGKTVCTFVQKKEGNDMTTGILPKTLDILLKQRKVFKEKMEDTQYDDAQRSVFNGLQLAYKVVANSVYGQCGSRTSPIRKMCVAACTTAAGRTALYKARSVAESEFGATVVYGDTDSIFVKFPTKDVAESIRLGIACGKSITNQMRRPYKIAYEKTFYPFILFCRKRYVGMKYEEDPNPAKAKRMSMGIVLKRRDNAPIVKDVFGGALDILLRDRDVKKAQSFVNEILIRVLENKIPLEKFIVSKSLRDDYKNPEQIAHRVLADRMTKRDPGTAPKVGDRLQYVHVAEYKDKAKQGDKIEHLDYVRSHKMKPDVNFYITNQIQNPVAQLFALCIDQLDGYKNPTKESYKAMYSRFFEKLNDEEEATLAVLKKKEDQLDGMMFLGSPILSKIVKASVRGPMDMFVRK